MARRRRLDTYSGENPREKSDRELRIERRDAEFAAFGDRRYA